LILADTSIWIDHFRSGDKHLRNALNQRQILMHQCIVAELALGPLRDRAATLAMLDQLPQARVAQASELRLMIEARRLFNLGIGLTDMHLIASVFITQPSALWTRDKQLRRAAERLGIHANLP
jgi:predicted nucleic acid-binding protein